MTNNNRKRLMELVKDHCDKMAKEGKKAEVLELLRNERKYIWRLTPKKGSIKA